MDNYPNVGTDDIHGNYDEQLVKAVATARRLADEQPHDLNLAVYVVRDFLQLKEWELSDLAWSMYRNTITRNDLDFLLEKIEERLEVQQDANEKRS